MDDLRQNRFINVESNWWNDAFAKFNKTLKPVGVVFFEVETDTLNFQAYARIGKFLSMHFLPDDFPMLRLLARQGDGRAKFYVTIGDSEYVDPRFEVRSMSFSEALGPEDPMVPVFNRMLQEEIAAIQPQVEEILRAYAARCVEAIREEYEYLTSDEAVMATLNKGETA